MVFHCPHSEMRAITSCPLHEDAVILVHGSKALRGRSALGTADLFSSAKDGGVLQPDPRSPVHACVPIPKNKAASHTPPPRQHQGRGLQAVLATVHPSSPSPGLSPTYYLATGKNLTWVEFGWNKQLTLWHFPAISDQDISVFLPIMQSLPGS